MFRLTSTSLIVAAVLCVVPGADAGTISATLSSPQNLSDITVGELVTIDVNLQGVTFGSDFIYDLDTKVIFPTSLFSAVPDPTNSSGLTTSSGPSSGYAFYYATQPPAFYATSSLSSGDAVGIFNNSLTAPPINQGGIYYSFTLKAIATGDGSISFDTSVATNNQYASNTTPNFYYIPLPTGGPLSVSISSVPEPSSLFLGGIASLLGLTYAGYRRRKPNNRQPRPS